MSDAPWDVIHSERRRLATDLGTLQPAQWEVRSLCNEWSVYQTFAHITSTAKMSPRRFIRGYIKAGFKFDHFTAQGVAAESANGPAATLAEFQTHMDDETSPPGPIEAMVGEIIVHGEDIRRPLGIAHSYPPEAVLRVAQFYVGSNALLGSKRRVDGVKLVATDGDWTHGSGPQVTGPLLSLVLAMTGRSAALVDLDGDGVPVLESRSKA
ncbi:TIGR03083 family protein [Frankineae bacterium MT45]|nr:TIGR03083 family protein [Frankineae bacterium MT45]